MRAYRFAEPEDEARMQAFVKDSQQQPGAVAVAAAASGAFFLLGVGVVHQKMNSSMYIHIHTHCIIHTRTGSRH